MFVGLFEKVEETEQIAASLADSGGVYFVPAFSGLQVSFLLHQIFIMFYYSVMLIMLIDGDDVDKRNAGLVYFGWQLL